MASFGREYSKSGGSQMKTSISSSTKSGAVRKAPYKVRRNEKGETELHRACINGDYNTAERLLLKGHPVNEKDHGGWTCLHEACNWGFKDIVKLLIEHGANIEAKGMANVTPLLDATANGQFDIINILLKAGASIAAVDGDGNTLLDLLETFKRNAESLCAADEAEYQKLKKLLEDRMKKDGIPLHRIVRPQTNRSTVANIRQEDKRTSSNVRPGVDLYASAMSSIGRSAARKSKPIFNYESFNAKRSSKRGNPTTAQSKPALISENDYEVSDDWMIDDMNGHYIRPDPCDSKKRSRVRGSRETSPLSDNSERSPNEPMDPVHVIVDDCFDPELPTVKESRPRASTRPRHNSDDDLVLISEKPGRRRSPKRRRLHQTRLVTVSTPSPVLDDDFGFGDHNDKGMDEILPLPAPVRNISSSISSFVPPPTEVQSSSRSASEFVRVNVLVEGRKFAVIIDSRLHTIEWLADCVSANYESATGKRPIIRLYTADEAALSASDTVEFLFYQNEQLIGKVERIDILPMEESYRQICQRQKQEAYGDICDFLRNAGQSTALDFRQTSLRLSGGPSNLLKTLQSEYSLTILNLRGQKLTTSDAVELGRALTNLPLLSSLIVSCSGMHCDQVVALATEICRERDKQYVLEKLDVSFNAIGDTSASHLSRILVRCPQLRFLNVQCIAATARFVQDNKAALRDAFSSTSLTYLNLSRNRLGDAVTDLQTILSALERYVELKLY